MVGLRLAQSQAVGLNIDIFRSYLAQWVIIAHIAASLLPIPLIPGRLAVWGFFVTSGYLNAVSFSVDAKKESFGTAAASYYSRRLWRIYPLLFISYIVVSIVTGNWLNDDRWILIPYTWNHTLAYQNSVLWTLAVEIQLYALTPLLCVAMAATFLRNRATLTIVSALVLIYAISAASVLITHNTARIDDRSMLGNLGFYLLGMALAIHRSRVEIFVQRWRRTLIVTTGLYLVAFLIAYNLFSTGTVFYAGHPLAILIGVMVLGGSTPLHTWGKQVFTALGHSTYEIYVIHGLGVFIFTQYIADDGWVWMLVLEWAVPILAALALTELSSRFRAFWKRETLA